MGFFSFKCKGCGESIKAPYELPKSMVWQNRVIVAVSETLRLAGAYDGYGRVNLDEPAKGLIRVGGTVEEKGWTYILKTVESLSYGCYEGVWHQRCAPSSGGYGPSDRDGGDQGYFYERLDDVHLHRPFQNPDKDGRVDTSLVEEFEVVDSFNAAEAEDDQE